MRKWYTLALAFAAIAMTSVVSAQNRIQNPGFETVTGMPTQGNQLNLAPPWSNCNGNYTSFSVGTPDLFHASANNNMDVPSNFMADCNAHTGNAITGVVTWNDNYTDYREYMSIQFYAPLIVGNNYEFSFWWSHGTDLHYKYITDNLGVVFSMSALQQTGWNLVSATPVFEITTNTYNAGWTQCIYSFTATAAYDYVTIGNFRSDAQTQHTQVGSNQPYGYFFLDDFCLLESGITLASGDCSQPYTVGIAENESGEDVNVFPNPSNGAITFTWASSVHPESLDIYDVTGQLMFSMAIPMTAENRLTLDRSAFTAGSYYYRLAAADGRFRSGKFVIIEPE